ARVYRLSAAALLHDGPYGIAVPRPNCNQSDDRKVQWIGQRRVIEGGNAERAEELFRKALEHSPEYSANRELGWLLSKNLHSAPFTGHPGSTTDALGEQ